MKFELRLLGLAFWICYFNRITIAHCWVKKMLSFRLITIPKDDILLSSFIKLFSVLKRNMRVSNAIKNFEMTHLQLPL
uniref:Uncharacterized protein LOC106797953 n=1 Tax=Rhizophora mucronata TaxID=61149 RepID=A0A2P2MD26_RHIMU